MTIGRWKYWNTESLRREAMAALIALAPAAHGDGWQFGGHAKIQYDYSDYRAGDAGALYGEVPARDQTLDARLKAEWRGDGLDFAAHYELLALAGDSVPARRALAAAGLLLGATASGLPDDHRRLFDLTSELIDRERATAVQRLDRLSLGYRDGRGLVRFGRQAVSWGNGLVFHPLDFVNPFSPIAIDKDYKTGDDMLYGQWGLAAGGDVQAIVLPRRDPATGGVEGRESTAAIKLRRRAGPFDLDLLVARHYDQPLAGLGAVRSLGGAVWRLDAAYAGLPDGGGALSLVTNLDYSWTWGGKNVYGYLEYFRSGVGETERARYAAPNPDLAARLARGELYTLARDYAALGLQIELTPLLNLFNSLVWNLDDGSFIYQLRLVYDWRQNTQLMVGAHRPHGARGDEYGGVAAGSGVYVTPGRSYYARLAYYF
jgi:hypothetical protein